MRNVMTALLVLAGLILMGVGYASSAPWGASSVADADPAFLGAPTMFILGIVMVLSAALVYELIPERDYDAVD